jgi:acetyltransferase-like isoleucine patch superfamily enzyme/dTDP-4-dehydrorhamnose 3,5-epimerase-like enzyme
MSFFLHPQGICESDQIGSGTRIWAFAHVLKGARIGADCNICDHVFVENDVVIGNRVTVKSGVQLWDGIRLDDDVFVGPNVTFSNDPFPRSKHYRDKPVVTTVCAGASVGANSTVLPGVTVGRDAMIGAGTVVIGNVPAGAIVTGNPGRITGYVDTIKHASVSAPHARPEEWSDEAEIALEVRGAWLHRLHRVDDLRGALAVGTFPQFPFAPRRYFVMFDVPSKHVRGEHAHRRCQQFLTCLRGSVTVMLDDGQSREEIVLSDAAIGVYVPAMVWLVHYKYSADAMLLVLASDEYDPDDYIRDYEEFRRAASDLAGRSPHAAENS